MSENTQPKQPILIPKEIKDVFAVMSIAVAAQGRTELATFCLLLAAIEERGGLEALARRLKPELGQLVADLEMSQQGSLQEWPEEIELNEN